MPPGDLNLVNLLGAGTGTTILAAAVVAFLNGWIVPKKTHEAAIAAERQAKEAAEGREAELWEILKGVTGLTVETASIAKRSTRIAETQVAQASWAATEAGMRRGRRPHPPKGGAP